MIFSEDIKQGLAEITYKNMDSAIVYKGKQPSLEDYIIGVNNGTYTWTGNFLLQGYTGIDLHVVKVSNTYRIEKDSPSRTFYGDYMCQDGKAEWAVLFHQNTLQGSNKLLEFNSSTNQVNFLRNITDADLFMIVPVSDMLGVGVMRFISIDFVADENNPIKRFSLNFYTV
jgi:hypothetical protein